MWGKKRQEKKHQKKHQKQQLTMEAVSSIVKDASWRRESVARALNPAKLARLLQTAAEQYSTEYLTLAEEMEEKDPHYAGVLGVRKRAVNRLSAVVEAADESTESGKHAAFVQGVVEAPEFESMVYDLTDAFGKGYSAVEIMWDMSGSAWMPASYEWRDPRWFVFDTETMRTLRVYDASIEGGRALPAYKFIVHLPRLKSGLPIRGGLARLVAVSYMCKQFVLSDWLSFMDLYGMPIRIGKYGPGTDKKGIEMLKSAVAGLAVDGGAVISDNMEIAFQQMADSKSSAGVFKEAAQWLDEQVSKAVLGQTMTTDNGSSKAQAEVHNDVRLDILEADANELQNTINTQLVKPMIDLNFGVQERYPRVIIRVPRPENLQLLVDSAVKLVPLGVKIPARWMCEKLGIPEPNKDEALLGTDSPTPPSKTLNSQQTLAMNNAGEGDEDAMPDEWPDEWAALPDEVAAWVRRIADNAKSLGDVKRQLAVVPELNSEAVQAFAVALVKERIQ